MSVDASQWLTSAEAVAMLQCSPAQVRNFARRGLITARDTIFRRRYDRESVQKLLLATSVSATKRKPK
jgi:hypothetical protein